mmetsp:Transcript_5734/g.13961  ORF Transcript_5734/g.13961 Transcript_5734/m.13961 type:complete len:114 (+) Transcript_5734:748-1089(+)
MSDFRQELGSNEEIEEYVKENFPQVDFPIMSLSSLNTNPVYKILQEEGGDNGGVKWNFFKYLVDGNGQVVKMYDQRTNPLSLTEDIESLLQDEEEKRNTVGRQGGRRHKLVIE